MSSGLGIPVGSGAPGLSGFPYGSFAVIGEDIARGIDSPNLFTAFTLKL